ncbi:MAG: site-specific DNA-methyltransferase [Rhodobacteraceae bacterium]|jgi:DNA modification methylase|nr:site-specific DNA-methyltransferase [Paracoccaceae bacterium]HBG99415.1 DNA methylase [Paracoccaceae bacterium]
MTLAFAPERIETWPLARLQPYAQNAKLHGPDQVAKIAASMAEFGWTVPCLVGDDGELIAGHGRVLAATQLGLTEAPVIVLGHLTEAQRRAYRIADNRLAESPWNEELLSAELQDLLADDYDLSLVGFTDGELDKLLAFDPDGGGEEEGGAGGSVPPVTIPEPPRNPASRTGDLWILGDHRLLCGDSTSFDDVRRLMKGERAVLFATDPPYLVDYDGSNHPTRNKDWSQSYGVTWDDSSQGAELYDGFIAAAVAEAITEDAAWYCWHASRRQAMLEACWEKAGAFVHQQIIWVKDRGVLTRSHYLWKHEPCLMGWRRPNRPPKVAEQTLPSTWEMPSFAKDERPDHPTPKPLDAFGIPMRQHVARGGLCYEPFSGSGSQIMAGEANARRVFAMEISPAYVDVAVERWQAETGREAILDGDGRSFAEVRTERLEETPPAKDEDAAA